MQNTHYPVHGYFCLSLSSGIDMFEMELAVDRDVLKVQLWWVSIYLPFVHCHLLQRDTCGQECYDSITTSYYRGATVSCWHFSHFFDTVTNFHNWQYNIGTCIMFSIEKGMFLNFAGFSITKLEFFDVVHIMLEFTAPVNQTSICIRLLLWDVTTMPCKRKHITFQPMY